MMTTVRDPATRTAYHLDKSTPLASGGEAFVYAVKDHPNLVAKVYRAPRPERAEKLAFMLANPPLNPTAAQNHLAYAWPTALLTSSTGRSVIGFLMPRVVNMMEVFTVYNPGTRKQFCAEFNYRYLTQTARNIAWVMAELHSKGYLIGDVSQKNVVVSDAALVTVLDTDSFEFRDPKTNFLHLCKVRTPGFIAPEGYVAAGNAPRAIAEDRFGLAVMVFHLLMEGWHPFACRYTGPGESPRLQENVIGGNFPYKHRQDPLFLPPRKAPPFSTLPPQIQALFVKCFVEGHKNPDARPAAREWQKALTDATKNLVQCSKSRHHYYHAHLGSDCPWCGRTPDPFPGPLPPPPRRPKARTAQAAAAPAASTAAKQEAGKSRMGMYVALVLAILFLLRLLGGW